MASLISLQDCYRSAFLDYLYAEHYKLTTKTTSYVSTNFIIHFNSFLFILILTVCLICFFLSYGLKVFSFNIDNADNYDSLYNYLSEVEEEVGSIDDVLVFGTIFLILIGWFYFFLIFFVPFVKTFSWIVALLSFISFITLFVPTFILKNYGISFFQYIRGAGRTSSLLAEAFYDLIAVSVMTLRFVIQNMRFIFIFMAFFELYEFLVSTVFMYNNLFFTTLWYKNVSFTEAITVYSGVELISYVFITLLSYIYYFGHFSSLFITQLATYFVLSFLLFFFLYTHFLLNPVEKYFLTKQ